MVDIKDATIREATTADKEAVLSMRDDVYGGRDYLPAFYDNFMFSPYTTSFVVLIKERIVCFSSGTVIDGGETIVGRSRRVCKEYEGMGFARLIDEYVNEWGKKNHVHRKVTVSSENHLAAVTKPSFTSINEYILTKDVMHYQLVCKNLKVLQSDIQLTHGLSLISDSLLARFFRSETISHHLFPQGRIVVNSVPYRVQEENIPVIREQGDATVILSDVQSDSDSPKGMLSIGTMFPVRKPDYAYNIELYGNDYSSIRIHIIRHLIRLAEKSVGLISIFVFLDEEVSFQDVDKVFFDYGIKRTVIPGSTKRMVFERSLIQESGY